MESILVWSAGLVFSGLIFFSLLMLFDCWKNSSPLWFLYLLFFSVLPMLLMLYSILLAAPMHSIFSLTGGGVRSADSGALVPVLAVAALVPFASSVVYYYAKYRKRILPRRNFLIAFCVVALAAVFLFVL